MNQQLKKIIVSFSRRDFIVQCIKLILALPVTMATIRRYAFAAQYGQVFIKEAPMKLPHPEIKGKCTLEKAIQNRRTIRSFSEQSLPLWMFSQILWSAQGITGDHGFKRAAPSAGALYPMDIYAVIGEQGVDDLPGGIVHYEPNGHMVTPIADGDFRKTAAQSALGQHWMARAPAMIVITAEYHRVTGKYGKRGIRYAYIEAGHIGQNIFLQAEALGLRAGIVGAFHDKDIRRVMKIPHSHEPLLMMPVGYER